VSDGWGIASMHYIGMAAMRMSYIIMIPYVLLSVVFRGLISSPRFWITFHLQR